MNRERQQQFLEYLADQYKFYRDRREVFFARFDPANADKPHNQLHLSFEDDLNREQKIQYELQNIGERLKQDGCEIVSKKGRAKKGGSPWEQAYNWLWTVKFPEWEKDHETPEEGINWKNLCTRAFWEEKTRRKRATEKGHEVQVYVPLGLVKRKQQPRRTGEEMPVAQAGMQQYQLTEKEIEERYEHEKFLAEVIGNAGKNLAIIGELGAGKTTWLDQIGQELIKTERYPIWIPLARLQGMTLEAFLLEKWLKEKLGVLPPTPEQKDEFIEWFKTEKVWVLLDGADEMSAANPVVEIGKSLTGWVKQARVVLSCRLNVWESNLTTLEGFETYRTLCFEPEQVEQFITAWFEREEEPELGKQLAQKLQEAESARILDLVRNPLRLSLLCQSWRLNPGEIPETKADLYEKFCRNIYAWKQDRFPTTFVQQQQLNQQLAELALRGMRENVPLLESLVHEVLGEWVELAKNVGWLNVVYRDTRTDEPVYAFFHLTFQEYFAACAVADWHFFLPSDHSPEQPSSQPYRIFESRWREVILLCLGRGDVEEEKKEEFIEALVSFNDGCYQLYLYRAYFLAAEGIAQYSDFEAVTQFFDTEYSLVDQIIQQIIQWALGHFDANRQAWITYLQPIEKTAQTFLGKTKQDKVIQFLSQNLELMLTDREDWEKQVNQELSSYSNISETEQMLIQEILAYLNWLQSYSGKEKLIYQFSNILGTLSSGNELAISGLLKAIATTEDEETRRQAVLSLEKIAPGNLEAISGLLKVIATTEDEEIRRQGVWSLEKIAPGNPEAIAALLKVIATTEDEETRRQGVWSLGKIAPGNPEAIAALLKVIATTGDEYTRLRAAVSLENIDPGNPEAIAALLKVIATTEDEKTRRQAAWSLGKIITTNPQRQSVVSALQPHLSDETYENNFDLFKECYNLLWNIAQDLPYPDFYRAWHHLDTAPHPEVADQTPVGKTALTDTLNAQLLDLPNQLHPTPHTTPVCVDIQHLTQITDEDKLAKALSNRIFKQLFPGQTLPKISDCFDLETELINAQPRPHIALILHNGDPQESLLHLCQFLAPTVSIAWITPTPLDAPLRSFPPDRENLVSALQSWLDSLV
ncbi:MAG TPA: hypothetical protein DD761_19840 [Cyanobacteria bacterium UBA11691]|nr:hypothetical protein [Cyanobacteria bacterium UBA11691]